MSAFAPDAILLFVASCLYPALATAQWQTIVPEGHIDRHGIRRAPAYIRSCREPTADSYATGKA
jgi:hypothetical protein